MDIAAIVKELKDCPCGRLHETDLKSAEIGHGLTEKTGEILRSYNFPDNFLLVADKNTLAASNGITDSLDRAGFCYKIKIYDDMRVADISDARDICALSKPHSGILSVGTGSLNDICRHGIHLASLDGTPKKAFAIFATAPSMDGFASGTAPITENGFKETRPGVQPDVLIADTAVLAASPAELKSAGFGDIMAKFTALADWRVSALLTGEYYCEKIAALTRTALNKVVALAGKVTENDEETAGAIMEALIFTGVAMKLADCVRPASGAEHMISHFWEMMKLKRGELSDFHGKKVSVATYHLCGVYHKLADMEKIEAHPDVINKAELESVYGSALIGDIMERNSPAVTAAITPESLEQNWSKIRLIVKEEVPPPDTMLRYMKAAGSATAPAEIAVDENLADLGYKYHAYMRRRLTLSRLIPMLPAMSWGAGREDARLF